MASKNVFAKKGAVLRPMTGVNAIIRATKIKLKPIYGDIMDNIIKGIISYKPVIEAFRNKEADFSRPNVKKLIEEYQDDIEAVLLPAATTAARLTATSVANAFGNKMAASFFKEYIRPVVADRVFKIVSTDIIPSIEKSLKEKFNTAIADGWSLKKLEKDLIELKGNYATIARTEVLSASAQAERMQSNNEITNLGIAGRTIKEWHMSGSGKERASHIEASINYGEGRGIPYKDDFILTKAKGGSEPATGPMDPRLSAGNFINCQCHTVIKVLPIS